MLRKVNPTLEEIPVVRDFPEVFPDDLPDDIFVYSRSMEEHEQHLRIVLQILKEKELYAILSKCEFWISKVIFLGHVISGDRVMPDPAKVKAIMEWRVPKNANEVKSVLGGGYVVYTDASKHGLGCVLMQNGKVIAYASRKANVVADALSRKSSGILANLGSHNLTLLLEMRSVNAKLEVDQMAGLLAALQLKPDFVDQIKEVQTRDPFLLRMLERVKRGKKSNFSIRDDGVIVNGERICVPDVEGLRREILQEAHNAPYSMHPGTTKMYRNLTQYYWWQTMKKDVAEFVAKCMICQQVKAEHQAPADRLTKLAHFLPIRLGDSLDKLAELYVSEIIRLHGVPISIVSDRDPRFT
ncbi:UNVERIFIED_CONTAM: putative mitochondrial protein [Sesamum latifolium]|uniref:Mitochondrial protein n=1 Tax=Sesamum latifolium TaxID=2727402 RepID=A0AAW2X7G7_9LAMI